MTRMSRHAQVRSQQRGITHDIIASILEHGDVEMHVGDNCRLIRLSRKEARCLGTAGDKLRRFGVILSDTTNQIVSVLPIHDGSRGRPYRSRH